MEIFYPKESYVAFGEGVGSEETERNGSGQESMFVLILWLNANKLFMS